MANDLRSRAGRDSRRTVVSVGGVWMVTLALTLGLTGCGTIANKTGRLARSVGRLVPWSGKKEKDNLDQKSKESQHPKKPLEDSVKIGEIVYVHREQGFALIRSTYDGRMATGTEIRGHLPTGKETCVLRCSPERKSGFIVADIASGDPQVGQFAFSSRAAIQTTEAGSVDVPGAARPNRSTRSIPGLSPSGAGSTGVDELPPLPDLPSSSPSIPLDELPDFPID
jgi:hypothetical protein